MVKVVSVAAGIESCIAVIIVVIVISSSCKKDYIAINWMEYLFVLFIMVQTGHHIKDHLESSATVDMVSYNL